MATNMPAGLDTFTASTPSTTQAAHPHSARHNNLEDAVKAIERIVVGPTYYNVEGRAEATFDLRFAAAKTEAESTGGVLVITPGPKNTGGLGTISKPNVSIWAPGGAIATPITRTSGTEMLRWQNSPITVDQQGYIKGLRFVNTAGGVIGLSVIDSGTLPDLEDVIFEVTGVGSTGMKVLNTSLWNERAGGRRIQFNHCTLGLDLVGTGINNSLAYHRWLDLRLNLAAGQIGIRTSGTALVYSGLWHIMFNIDGTGATVFQLKNGTSISGWAIIEGEQTTGTGGIFRDCSDGGIWALAGYFNVLGCTDTGVGSIFSPFEINPTGRVQRRWPLLPTLTMGAAAGTSPPAPILTGNDCRGTILTGTGAAPAAGNHVTLTYAAPFDYVPIPIVTPFGVNSANLVPFIAAASQTGFTVGFALNPTASQPVGTYGFMYSVEA